MFDENKEKIKSERFKTYLEDEHRRVLSSLIKNKDFRFYMAELLGFCKTFENAFNEKGNVAAFQNGKQAVGQKIFNDIMLTAPEYYVKMCQEEQEILAMRNNIGEHDGNSN